MLAGLPLDRPLPWQVAPSVRRLQICALIEREAKRVGMSPHFFARLLHRESLLDPTARSPVGATGIAQFMPRTAAEMRLDDPGDVTRAIPASADLLAKLRAGFGSWPLAAAAYNAGPGRVRRWLAGEASLPGETRAYVHAITGRKAARFKKGGTRFAASPLVDGETFAVGCLGLPASFTSSVAVVPDGVAPAMPAGIVLARVREGAEARPVQGPPPVVLSSESAAPAMEAAGPPKVGEPAVGSTGPEAIVRAESDGSGEPTIDSVPVPVPRGLEGRPIVVASTAPSIPADTTGAVAGTVPVDAVVRLAALPIGELPTLNGFPKPRDVVGPPHPLDRVLPKDAPKKQRVEQICHLIHREATRVGMPPSFFARLINKESRFDIFAISPVGAQGVAQFMPYTARERGLKDPFEPVEAIPASANYLWELRGELGSWALAAAGYNAGPGRVRDFFAGRRLPPETRDYVHSIALRPADAFKDRQTEIEVVPLDPKKPFMESCRVLPTKRFSKPKSGNAPAEVIEPWQPWGVQLSASFVRSSAVASFDRQVKRYEAVLKGRRPLVIVTPVRGSKRKKYAARLGAPDRRTADALCAKIKRAGGACVVLRNKK